MRTDKLETVWMTTVGQMLIPIRTIAPHQTADTKLSTDTSRAVLKELPPKPCKR
jgi:hypothetical protein